MLKVVYTRLVDLAKAIKANDHQQIDDTMTDLILSVAQLQEQANAMIEHLQAQPPVALTDDEQIAQLREMWGAE